MADGNMTLSQAFEKAANAEGTQEGMAKGEGTESTAGSDTTESETGESSDSESSSGTGTATEKAGDEVVEIEASAEEVNNALAFYRSLGKPETRDKTLQILAAQAGYDLNKKSEAEQFAKDTKALFKEELGDAYDLLNGDGLANAVDKLIANRINEATKPLTDKLTLAEVRAEEAKVTTEMNAFFKAHNIKEADRDAVAMKMTEKMRSLPPGPDINVRTYLDDIYSLTHPSEKSARDVKKVITRIKENASELKNSGSTADESRIKKGPGKLPTLEESVNAAFRGEKFDFD